MADTRVLIDLTVQATVDDVWAALTDPVAVRQWFGWEYEGLDDEIRLIFAEQATADGGAHTLAWPDGDSIVLTERDGGTGVQVRRPPHGPTFDGVHDPVDEGWITFLHQLRFALERHRGQERRTVMSPAVDLGSDDDPLLARLGLRGLGDEAAGEPYSVERPDGSRFAGQIWFQTDLQIGLTVADEGDALLVVARTPPGSAPPRGSAMFLLNLYGYDDAQVADAERRWTAWWAGDAPQG